MVQTGEGYETVSTLCRLFVFVDVCIEHRVDVASGVFLLRIFVLYTFYIVWEGAGPYMQVEEKIRLKFVGTATGLILLTPWLIEVILSMLMPGLRF